MELPIGVADVVLGFAEAVRPLASVTGFYVGGSLATGDFHPGVSDFDLVALVRSRLRADQRAQVRSRHETLLRDEPAAAKLHCVYVPVPDVADVAAPHLTWSHGQFHDRPLSGVARAELLRFGITVFGPAPGEVLPPVTDDALRAAALAELSGYWTGALAEPHLWLEDLYVDLGLVTLARVEATTTEGRLITKAEAFPRLARFGIEAELVQEIERRRRGQETPMAPEARARRATHVRDLMTAGIERLLRD